MKRSSSSPKCSGAKAPKWMLYVAFGLLAVMLFTLIYHYVVVMPSRGAASNPTMQERFAEPPAKMTLFYMNGCGWCDKFMPAWDQFASMYGRDGVLQVSKVEASDKEALGPFRDLVKGFPTVVLVTPDGKRVRFEGDRTVDGLSRFARDNGVALLEKFEI